MKQLGLFDRPLPVVKRADPTTPPEANQRLDGNCAAVLAALREGPKTNIELAEIGGQRFGARLHELKKAGYLWAREVIPGTEASRWKYHLTFDRDKP